MYAGNCCRSSISYNRQFWRSPTSNTARLTHSGIFPCATRPVQTHVQASQNLAILVQLFGGEQKHTVTAAREIQPQERYARVPRHQ